MASVILTVSCVNTFIHGSLLETDCMYFYYRAIILSYWHALICLFYIYSPNWIKVYGEEYHYGDYIIIGKQEDDDLPVFSKILDIITIVDYPVVEVTVFRTVGLQNHLLSYQIENTLSSCCISLRKLAEHRPYMAHTFDDGNLYITVKSHVEKNLLQTII